MRRNNFNGVDGFSQPTEGLSNGDLRPPVKVGRTSAQKVSSPQAVADGFRRPDRGQQFGEAASSNQIKQLEEGREFGEILPDFSKAADDIDESALKQVKLKVKTKSRGKIKLVRRTVGLVAVVLIGFGLFTGARVALNAGNVFKGGGNSAVLSGEVEPEVLRKEGDGRVNTLVIGIGGEGHDGANLADTIMIASLNPFDKQGSLISIPRDFYVEYRGEFMRINAVHSEGEKLGEGMGPKELQSVLEGMLDIPIHYHVRVDFAAMEQGVDTLGGIDVVVEDELYDPGVANTYGKPLAFKPGTHTMDGRTALFYSRSRVACGSGCNGIGGGDLLRTQRQKEVMQAMFNKGLSKGIFSSPSKVQSLMSNFSENVKTSIGIGDLMAIYNLAKDIDVSLLETATVGYADDDGNQLLADYTSPAGAAVLRPALGLGDYRDISNFVKSKMIDSYITREKPRLAILNAAGVSGLASEYEDLYKAMGYEVVEVGNYNQGVLPQTELVELNSKPYAKNFIQKRFGINGTSDTATSQDKTTTDYVIILGADAESN